MNSQFLRLNAQDVICGAIVAGVTAILAAIVPVLEAGGLPTVAALKGIGISGLAAGGAYLLKNLFTNSQHKIGAEPKNG